MRITIVIMTVFLVQVSAASVAQQLSLRNKNITLKEVFTQIRKQTGYTVLCESDLMDSKGPVSVNFDKTPLEKAIKELLSKQNLSYEIKNKAIIVTEKVPSFLEKVVDTFTPPINVSGVVLDEKGVPLPGATVKLKGFKQSVVTDKDGKFYLPGVDDKAVLVISYVGYADKEVSAKAEVSVSLEMKSDELQEVVVAYGRQEQRAITGAVTVVKGSQIESLPNLSVDKSLQALVPGLLVTQGSGQPGGGTGNFVLRGISTGGSAVDAATVRNPLFVIDGVPVQQDPAQATTSSVAFNNPMAQINPLDIESISILKDASAIALYGSKASNGVILVTTKRGKSGKTIFNFRHQTDLSTRLSGTAKPLNQQQYLELLFETYKNTDPVKWTDAAILSDLAAKFPHKKDAAGNISFYEAPDWLNELYDKNAVTSSNNLSISGGNEKSNFYLNLEYTDQNGIQKKTGYDRKSARLNSENRVTDWFKVGLNTTLSYNLQNYSYSNSNEDLIAQISPLNALRNESGDYIYNYTWGYGNASSTELNAAGFPKGNVAASKDLDIYNNTSYRGISNLSAELKFLKNFSFTTNLGVNVMLTETKEKHHPLLAWNSYEPGVGVIIGASRRTASLISTNLIKYDYTKNEHHFDVMAAQEAQILTSDSKFIQEKGIAGNPETDQLNGTGTLDLANGNTTKQTLLSYFGQANYSYLNRYYLTGSIRTDGSSVFGENKRFGTHWSAGAAWIISAEEFMDGASGWLDYLKLRSSIGSAGNSSAIISTYKLDHLSYSNYMGKPSIRPNSSVSPGNPDIQWEKTLNMNIGIDSRFLKDRFAITVDLYKKRTSNLIASSGLPFGTGFIDIYRNIGDLNNSGVELTISADAIRTKHFKWTLNSSWSSNKNILVRSFLPFEKVLAVRDLANGAGKNYNSFYMPTWAGVNPENGKPQWFDELGNRTADYNKAKPDFVGKPQPDGFGSLINSFRFKSFELAATLYYQYGFKLYNYNASTLLNDGAQPYLNQGAAALDRWQKPGDIASNPRRLLFGKEGTVSDQSTAPSTRYLYDGDFLRLSNVVLAYSFDPSRIQKYGLNGLKLFVQGNNLKTWTKYQGNDPESSDAQGLASSIYPLARSFSFGINVNF